jgi:hypothetical protein
MVLTTLPPDPLLDLPPWMGQRSATFRFDLSNGATGEQLGEIHPLRPASLTHDTTRVIKRKLTLDLDVEDTARVNPLTDRVSVTMIMGNGDEWPLGRYMFTDQSKAVFTSGKLSNVALNDEMFLIDQEITVGFNAAGLSVGDAIQEVLAGLPITYDMEPSTFISSQSWGIGSNRGSILEALAVAGDYFPPWFGNDGNLHFIRAFNPADKIPQFDFDTNSAVLREGITETSDLLTAPNRFVVISNAASNPQSAVVATQDVPPSAPHSFANRGFFISHTVNLQLTDPAQALAVVQGLANRQTIFERTTLATAPDPRHNSYDVVFWQGSLWLELAWSMNLAEGGRMNHLLRKAYAG